MPLVTVTAPPHPESQHLLGAVADAVAQALALGDGDVLAAFVAASAVVASGAPSHGSAPDAAPTSAWPIVSIHGGDRGVEAVDAACAAAESAVRDWGHRNAIEFEGVWTEWLTPRPPR
ncbi:hypothetical protein SAMN05428970_1165 [Agromyces sp. CF514]|uniref:hypothetical protein n=1 Tax=Agromyces sp. CF514 TaxID=1881031 RepID=UPI0008E71CDA|nr:hypothetical protein [Agromyces sp. CF514]SFR71339.1 hypothetical protein SAMN05428970_1165 [Agromyces sp. CF514]